MIYTCDRCGKEFPKRWKLTRHTERQYQCKAKAFVSEPVPASIPIQISEKSALPLSESKIIPASVSSLNTNLKVDKPLDDESEIRGSISSSNHIPKSANDRKPGETVKQWGSRLRKRYKEICYENYELPRTLKA